MKNLENYKVVILCGGQGTRIRAVAEDRPKPMVEIGGKPILWHIMKYYASFGLRKFVLALGHKGDKIVDYFNNYQAHQDDYTLRIGYPDRQFHPNKRMGTDVEDWEITFAHTGIDTMTGGRIKRIQPYIQEDHFFATYGDGVSNVDIAGVFETHRKMNNVATLVGVHLPTTFGIVEADENGIISRFREKPVVPGYVNGGFFCFTPEIFDHIDSDSTVLEDQPFKQLVSQQKIGMVPHTGFWHAMDNYKDYTTLNEMWNQNNAPWQCW